MINIAIDLGRHTMRVPHGIKKMFMDMITSLEITQGNFKIHLGENIRGINKKGMKFIKILPEFSAILVKAQPSGKDGRHVCTVYFPDMYKDELLRFSEILQNKVGQEDFAVEEIIESDKNSSPVETSALPEVESAEKILIKQQQYQAENSILTPEMQALILGDILDKKGTGWIEKGDLFKLLDALKLGCATNRLIGKLLRQGYLEDDAKNSGKRSRLTQAACLLISTPVAAPFSNIDSVAKEEDIKILTMLESLREASGAYDMFSADCTRAQAELERVSARSVQLQARLQKITTLIERKLEEVKGKILQKNLEIETIALKITPRMIEANRRLEIMFSDLPNE